MKNAFFSFIKFKTLFEIIIVLFNIFLYIGEANAATYYVSTDGNNNNTGLEDNATSAWQTIQYAVDNVEPGDTVIVNDGIYYENVTISKRGSSNLNITFKSKNIYGAIIDPTSVVTDWEPAPEIGVAVYKKTGFPDNPGMITIDNKRVGKINATYMNDGTGCVMLNYPSGYEVETPTFSPDKIYFWDAVGVLCGYKPDITTLYCRERDGIDPDSLDIRAADEKPAVKMDGASYITLDGFKIQGAYYNVFLTDSSNNIIKNLWLVHGGYKIYLGDGSANNLIDNNLMESGYYVQEYNDQSVFGAYSGNNTYLNRVRSYIYNFFKYYIGSSTSDDSGVGLYEAGNNNRITNNIIQKGLLGINGYTTVGNFTDGTVIQNNVIRDMDSVGITFDRGMFNTTFSKNWMEDNNINIRLHRILEPTLPRSANIHSNVLILPEPAGMHFYVHAGVSSNPEDYPEFHIDNNICYGGINPFNIESAEQSYGMDNTYARNNIFSNSTNDYSMIGLLEESGMAQFDYNILRGVKPSGHLDYTYGLHSLLETNPLLVNAASNDYRLQPNSPAIDAGADVGLTTDYAGNPIYGLPDIGAYEYQPPYTMGTDKPDIGADVRVYGGGKFRDRGTKSGEAADLAIIPGSTDTSQWLDVDISQWEKTGTRQRSWTEASGTITGNVAHSVGELEANKKYNVSVDGSGNNLTGCLLSHGNYICTADGQGKISFTYTGTYSTHTFSVQEGDNSVPAAPGGLVAN